MKLFPERKPHFKLRIQVDISNYKADGPLTDLELKLFEWQPFKERCKLIYPSMGLRFNKRFFGGKYVKISRDARIEGISNGMAAEAIGLVDEYVMDDLEIPQLNIDLAAGLVRLGLRVLLTARGEEHAEVREFVQRFGMFM